MSTDPENGAGFVDGFDESEDLTEDDIVTFSGEDGEEVQGAIVAVLEHDGNQYVVIQPVDQLEDDDRDEIDTYLFLYGVTEEGLPSFSPIDDDAAFEAVCTAFGQMWSGGESGAE